MNILYYCWNENSSSDIEETFVSLGHHYIKFTGSLSNYDSDMNFELQMQRLFLKHSFDFIFTFNYFPIISKLAQAQKIPYVSWVYDCPHLTIYSHTITNSCNYLFLFDQELVSIAIMCGAKHAYHMPLAINTVRLNRMLASFNHSAPPFSYDISFIGSLYENSLYDQIHYLPDYLKGYFDALFHAQQQIWGYSLSEALLTDSILSQMLSYVKFPEDPLYSYTTHTLVRNLLDKKITSLERIHLLNKTAESFSLDVFTGSTCPLSGKCSMHGFVSYTKEMPVIFHRSKINLNISLRSISSGIPLRCLDIMGAGGFLMSNYQPELTLRFIPGEEFVVFESEEDLLEKEDYYLNHELERMEIAENGWKKIQQEFSYQNQFQNILSYLS